MQLTTREQSSRVGGEWVRKAASSHIPLPGEAVVITIEQCECLQLVPSKGPLRPRIWSQSAAANRHNKPELELSKMGEKVKESRKLMY